MIQRHIHTAVVYIYIVVYWYEYVPFTLSQYLVSWQLFWFGIFVSYTAGTLVARLGCVLDGSTQQAELPIDNFGATSSTSTMHVSLLACPMLRKSATNATSLKAHFFCCTILVCLYLLYIPYWFVIWTGGAFPLALSLSSS